jgi:hypothetical protein
MDFESLKNLFINLNTKNLSIYVMNWKKIRNLMIFEKTSIESLVINDTNIENFACETLVSIPDKLKDLNNCFKY